MLYRNIYSIECVVKFSEVDGNYERSKAANGKTLT